MQCITPKYLFLVLRKAPCLSSAPASSESPETLSGLSMTCCWCYPAYFRCWDWTWLPAGMGMRWQLYVGKAETGWMRETMRRVEQGRETLGHGETQAGEKAERMVAVKNRQRSSCTPASKAWHGKHDSPAFKTTHKNWCRKLPTSLCHSPVSRRTIQYSCPSPRQLSFQTSGRWI